MLLLQIFADIIDLWMCRAQTEWVHIRINYLRFNFKSERSGFSNSLQILLKMHHWILILEPNYYKLLIFWITVPTHKSRAIILEFSLLYHTEQNQTLYSRILPYCEKSALSWDSYFWSNLIKIPVWCRRVYVSFLRISNGWTCFRWVYSKMSYTWTFKYPL